MYKKFSKVRIHPEHLSDDYVLESSDLMDDKGILSPSVRQSVSSRRVSRSRLSDLRASDFSLSVLIASGNTGLLKKSPVLPVSDFDAADVASSVAASFENFDVQPSNNE